MPQLILLMKLHPMDIKPKRLTLTVPPKRGPCPQGLNISYNTVRTVKSEKTTNGRNRKTYSNNK
jgi:hypothetical protein